MGNQCCSGRPGRSNSFTAIDVEVSDDSITSDSGVQKCHQVQEATKPVHREMTQSFSSFSNTCSIDEELVSVLKLVAGIIPCEHALIALIDKPASCSGIGERADGRTSSGGYKANDRPSSGGGKAKGRSSGGGTLDVRANCCDERPSSHSISLFDDPTRHSIGMFRQPNSAWTHFNDFVAATPLSDLVFVVSDALQDSRFFHNPLVTGEPGIRFFCGAALTDSDGRRLGTLCVADTSVRVLSPATAPILRNLAGMAVRHIERERAMRARNTRVQELQAAYKQQVTRIDTSPVACVVLRNCTDLGQGWAVVHANDAWFHLTGVTRDEVAGFFLADIFYVLGEPQIPSPAHQAKLDANVELTLPSSYLKKPSSRHFRYHLTCKPATLEALGVRLEQLAAVRAMPDAPEKLLPSCTDRYILMEVRQDERLAPRSGHTSMDERRSPLPSSSGNLDGMRVSINGLYQPSSLGGSGQGDGHTHSPRHAISHNSLNSQRSVGSSGHPLSPPSVSLSASTLCDVRNGIGGSAAKSIEGLEMGRMLGKGGFGSVYLGSWYGTKVAVKVMDGEIQIVQGEAKEGLLGLELRHPFVVSTLQYIVRRVPAMPPRPLATIHSTCYTEPLSTEPSSIVMHDDDDDDGFSMASDDFDNNGGGVGSLMLAEDEPEALPAQTIIVMEFCDKGALHEAVCNGLFKMNSTCSDLVTPDVAACEGAVNMPAVIATACEIVSALRFMHSHGIVHGDLSAWNVMLCTSGAASKVGGRKFVAKISDFGLSRCMGLNNKVQTRTYGCLTHMPPETLIDGIVCKGTDVYSFGVILWQMQTGLEPWKGLTKAQIVVRVGSGQFALTFPPDAPLRYAALATRCMSRDPDARPKIDEVWEELELLRQEYDMVDVDCLSP